jgi:hypothetical protein
LSQNRLNSSYSWNSAFKREESPDFIELEAQVEFRRHKNNFFLRRG